ncbi:MAG: alpha/beta hydrolase [Myxococcota bacterium]|nr:alpha/beta hydrolase [Myxococcota bacterium]
MAQLKASDGVNLYVERFDPEAEASGFPVIFSCAYSTTHVHWHSQVDALVGAGHRVGLWDYRGHGRSEAPADPERYSMEQVVSDLASVMDWLAPGEKCVLGGLSFGGLASLHLTRSSPERVRALVLADTGPGFKKPEAAAEWKQRSERTADFIVERGFEAFVTGKAAPTCIGRRPELPAAKAASEAVVAQDPQGVAHFGRRVAGLAPSVIDDLAAMSTPALVLVGEDDKAYLRAAEVMAAKLPESQYEVVAEAGHIVNIEQTDAFNRLVVDFLAQLSDA